MLCVYVLPTHCIGVSPGPTSRMRGMPMQLKIDKPLGLDVSNELRVGFSSVNGTFIVSTARPNLAMSLDLKLVQLDKAARFIFDGLYIRSAQSPGKCISFCTTRVCKSNDNVINGRVDIKAGAIAKLLPCKEKYGQQFIFIGTEMPTLSPTDSPISFAPSMYLTPTTSPTSSPTDSPTNAPSTIAPTFVPSVSPTWSPSDSPSWSPTRLPTSAPSDVAVTGGNYLMLLLVLVPVIMCAYLCYRRRFAD